MEESPRRQAKKAFSQTPRRAVSPRQTNSSWVTEKGRVGKMARREKEGGSRLRNGTRYRVFMNVAATSSRNGLPASSPSAPLISYGTMKYVEVQACLWHPAAGNLWERRGKFRTRGNAGATRSGRVATLPFGRSQKLLGQSLSVSLCNAVRFVVLSRREEERTRKRTCGKIN